MAMLQVTSVSGGYPGVHVLDDVSCSVDQGEVVALFGHNGAGKSTLLKAIFGLIDDVSGSVQFGDEEVLGESPKRLTHSGIAFVPQEHGVFPRLTVAENLNMGIWARGADRGSDHEGDLEQVFEYLPLLKARWRSHAGDLSGGAATDAEHWQSLVDRSETAHAR